jgi:hypothetical protein
VPDVYGSSFRFELKLSCEVVELMAESVKNRSPAESRARPPRVSCPVVVGLALVGSV